MRSVFVLIAVLAFAAGASAAPDKGVPRLLFPVVGTTTYYDDFGAPRSGGSHEGNDLLAERHAPAVAVEAGTVKFWTTSWAAGCMLYLYGKSGTTYLYIHLNNDLTAKNDNRGKCAAGTAYAPGLKSGQKVAAGELVGYVGDSGDANGIHPHLHFEVHPNDGGAVDPYPYLKKAQPLLFYAERTETVALSLTGTILSALDDVLKVKTSEVQLNSAKPQETERTLSLALAPDTTVTSPPPFTALNVLTRGLAVKVATQPVRATLAVQRGDANVLTASQIVVGG